MSEFSNLDVPVLDNPTPDSSSLPNEIRVDSPVSKVQTLTWSIYSDTKPGNRNSLNSGVN